MSVAAIAIALTLATMLAADSGFHMSGDRKVTENVIENERDADAGLTAMTAAMATKITSLRKKLGLSFNQFAILTGVSKGLLVQIEQARANPSVGILARIAAALGTSVADLLEIGDSARVIVQQRAKADDVVLWRSPQGSSATLHVGTNGAQIVNYWSWLLQPDDKYSTPGHPAGTQELLHVTQGSLIFEMGGKSFELKTGASLFAQTDIPHSYAAAGNRLVRFTMVVIQSAEILPTKPGVPRMNSGSIV